MIERRTVSRSPHSSSTKLTQAAITLFLILLTGEFLEHLLMKSLHLPEYRNVHLVVAGMILVCSLPILYFWVLRPVQEQEKVDGLLKEKLLEQENTRKRIIEELHQERQLFIHGSVVVFKWKAKEGWPVEYVSENIRAVTGWSQQDFISGRVKYADLIHPDDLERVGQEVDVGSISESKGFEHDAYRLRCKDGHFIWLKDHTNILRNQNGSVKHFLGYIVDISELVNANQANLDLERRILHIQKLESLGLLAGGIAHDFNNILVAILGNADMLQQDVAQLPSAKHCVEEIQQAARRATELAHQMLDYSGANSFRRAPGSLNKLIEDSWPLFLALTENGIAMEKSLEQNLPSFWGDELQLRQALLNVVTNAVESLQGKSGRISILTGVRECDEEFLQGTISRKSGLSAEDLPAGPYIFVEIKDEGCGMDAATMACLFDPFYTTKFTGRGLGLAALMGIIRAHKGTISVDTTPGEGSCFQIFLPLARSDTGKTAQADPKSIAPVSPSADKSVLVVDDEEQVRELARRMLESLGYRVFCVNNGEEACSIYEARASEIGLVLLDMTMPGMNGIRCYRRLVEMNADVRVILSSGFMEDDLKEYLQPGEELGYLQKPYSLLDMEAALDKRSQVLKKN